jgi:hypothetical protein
MTDTLTERRTERTTERLTSVEQLDFTPRGEVFPSPRDWRDQFIYQLLIDRYDDAQDHPAYDPHTAPRGKDASTSGCFQGGKIKGVTRRLDYIKGLGCTTIWLSPPFKNRQDCQHSCHGYGIQDFLAIDPRFGTLEDLQELVREAHSAGCTSSSTSSSTTPATCGLTPTTRPRPSTKAESATTSASGASAWRRRRRHRGSGCR